MTGNLTESFYRPMQHVDKLENLQIERPSMLAIGVFDGLHRGHQHLIRSLVEEAHKSGNLAGVLTFNPHPDEVLQGPKGRYNLTTVDERANLMAGLGADFLVTHPFNREVMQIRAADFVDRLVQYLNLCCLWVGEDFALGYRREGNVAFLTEQGQQKNFTVRAIPLVDSEENVVNSTAIRAALRGGDLNKANDWLGRSYSVTGEVIHGQKRGRKLGYPTANIEVPAGKLIPANGVYAGWAYVNDQRLMGATNVGYSPTFGNEAVTVETFILDFDGDLYGQQMTFTFEKYLRPEMKFNGLEALIEQMQSDVATTRDHLTQLAGR
ncbi:MAG: bifunctional riboflavin kinase/FAD synthetase [Chloroflexota bacterium]